MVKTPTRDLMKESAYHWSSKNLPRIACLLETTPAKTKLDIQYHGVVDGIFWSDEIPQIDAADKRLFTPIYNTLVHLRTSLILEEPVTIGGAYLLNLVSELCPTWGYNTPFRHSKERRSDYLRLRTEFFEKIDGLATSLGASGPKKIE